MFNISIIIFKHYTTRKVQVRYQTVEQEVVEVWLEGVDSRVFQHELDHLRGKLFIDSSLAGDLKLKSFRKTRENI